MLLFKEFINEQQGKRVGCCKDFASEIGLLHLHLISGEVISLHSFTSLFYKEHKMNVLGY